MFGFREPHFKDTTMNNGTVKATIRWTRFNPRFKQAQIWLDQTVCQNMYPYVPYKTGAFLGRIINKNSGNIGSGTIVTAVPPQGRYLYNGVSKYGKPLHYTNPLSTPRWFETVKSIHGEEWKKGVKDILRGKHGR